MAVQEKLYTADDLWTLSHLPENAGRRFELSEGVLIEMAPAGLKHGNWAGMLGRVIGNHVEVNGLGIVTAAETGFILHTDENGKDTVRAPDVGFISKERLPAELPDGFAPFAPDLAVEVVSPGDSASEIEQKVLEYLRHGTRAVWVFYPTTRTVFVHSLTSVQRLGVDDTLDGGDVLPGFTLKISEVFG